MSRHLFVYGTLMTAFDSVINRYLHANSRLIGPGRLHGRLFDLGQYPGLVPGGSPEQVVIGQVLELFRPEEMLRRLDEYEMIDPASPQTSEYRREELAVVTEGGHLPCWTYVYNWEWEGRPEIPPGSYVQYALSKPGHLQFMANARMPEY